MQLIKPTLALLITTLLAGLPGANAQNIKLSNVSWKQPSLSAQETKNLATALHFITDGIARGNVAVFDECVATDVSVTTGLKPSGPINGLG